MAYTLSLRPRHIPNIISIARIFLVFPVVESLLTRDFTRALIWFTAAGLSDGVDGFLARAFGWQSRLGSYLDPIADKLLLICSYACLAWLGLIPAWLAALVLGRDALILSGAVAYYFLMEPFVGQPALVSKLNTLCQLLLVFVILASPGFPIFPSGSIATLIGVVGFTTTISGIWYVAIWGRRAYRQSNRREH